MAATYPVIGQAAPTSSSPVDIVTVASGKQVIVSLINVTALVTTRPTLTIDVRPNGVTAGNATKLVKDAVITPGKAHSFGRGITMDATDVLTVTCSAGNAVAVQVFGTVI